MPSHKPTLPATSPSTSPRNGPREVPMSLRATIHSLRDLKCTAKEYQLPTDIHLHEPSFRHFTSSVRNITKRLGVNSRGEPYGRWNNVPVKSQSEMAEEVRRCHKWLDFFEGNWGAVIVCRLILSYRTSNGQRQGGLLCSLINATLMIY